MGEAVADVERGPVVQLDADTCMQRPGELPLRMVRASQANPGLRIRVVETRDRVAAGADAGAHIWRDAMP
jgi:hypothetical protein